VGGEMTISELGNIVSSGNSLVPNEMKLS